MIKKNSVLITGAAGGIGSSVVHKLFKEGWKVIATDLCSKKINEELENLEITWIPQDLNLLPSNLNELKKFIFKIKQAAKDAPLKAIIHNAAIQNINKFEVIDDECWQTTLNINLLAPISINRELIADLKSNKGSIVHIGSIHNKLTKPGFSSYATSKSALMGLTRCMAIELGNEVRVNAIEPSAILTPMLKDGFREREKLFEKLESFHPTESLGRCEDVANAVLFLIDPANVFLNGCILQLTGGIHNRLYDPC